MNRFDEGGGEFTVKVSLVSRYFPILSARLTTTVSE
jgi:3'-phosphoadenosine 5'-phosphosulfate (PAPS) 3'-phosphatase